MARRVWAVGVVLAAMFVQAAGCGSTPNPSPSPPGSDSTITNQFTTQDGVRLGLQTVVQNVDTPWSLAFAPDGRLFFTERPGRVRVYQDGQLIATPALTIDDVRAVGEGGLLGIALHPGFAVNHLVYLLYTANTPNGPRNRLARYREVNNTLGDRAILLETMLAANIHDGGRLRFGPDGKLYLTMGDASEASLAQSMSSLNGKILRLNDDASTPADNPFGGPIWSWGHRNPQGLDWHPGTGNLWATEHGQTGNDELNWIRKGLNYGWPVIEDGDTRPDMESPIRFFSPSIAPSGASFYTGTRMPALRGNFFFGCLIGQHIERIVLDAANPTRVQSTERWLDRQVGRIRDIVTGPDGALYFCTNNRDGRGSPVSGDDRIVRIIPVQ